MLDTVLRSQSILMLFLLSGAEPVSLGPGDFVTIAAGLKVTWDIKEGVSKHWK